MALLVKKRKTKMLYPYEGQTSRILKIEEIDRNKNLFNQSGEKTNVKSPPEKSYLYEVFFKIDMKKVLELKIQEISCRVLKSSTRKRAGNFIPMTSNGSSQIVASLYQGEKESMANLKNDISEKTLGLSTVNLVPEINSINSRSFRNATDEEVFGRVKRLKVVDPRTMSKNKKLGKSLGIIDERAMTESSEINKSEKGHSDFRQSYIKMISAGIDPASVFFSYRSLKTTDPKFQSENIENFNLKYPKEISEIDVETTRAAFESFKTLDTSSLADLSKNAGLVAIESDEVNRVRVIRHRFKITSSTLGRFPEFIVSLQIRDPETGLISESFNITIPHQINVENYYIPEFLPKLSISKQRLNPKTSAINASVSNVDSEKIKKIELYQRTYSDDAPLSTSRYSILNFENNFAQAAIARQPCYRIGMFLNANSTLNSYQMTTMRILPITVTGMRISNISSDTAVGKEFSYIFSSILASNSRGMAEIRFLCESEEVVSSTIYRKRKGDRKYTILNRRPYYSLNHSEAEREKALPSNLDITALSTESNSGNLTMSGDLLVRDKEVVDYKAKMFLKNGTSTWSRSIATNMYVEPIGAVRLLLATDPKIEGTDGQIEAISFNIEFSRGQTSGDQVLEILRDIGNEDIFKDVIESTRSTLSDLVIFGVTRQCLRTSESTFLGYTKAGKFTDFNEVAGYPILKGESYDYIISAYLANPDQIEHYFKAAIDYNKSVINSTNQIKMPSYIEKIRNSARSSISTSLGTDAVTADSIGSFENLKIEKYYSGRSLSTGTVRSNDEFNQDYSLDEYPTGDSYTLSIKTPKPKFTINGKRSSSITRSNKGAPVVRFSISPGEYGNILDIDCVVITCRRNGDISIAGACHVDNSGNVCFVDYGSKDFIGQIDYYASIVTNNGSRLSPEIISSAILLENRPSNITIKEGLARG